MRQRGDHVLLRQLFRGRVWTATPAVVVEEQPERLVFWLPPVTVGRARGDLFAGWELEERAMRRSNGILRLTDRGVGYSVLFFWHDDGSFQGWYINLEDPLVATPLGWDFEDHLLDVFVEPDLRWRWLDEDELEEAVRRRIFSDAKAREIRASGERALERALASESPFGEGWERWRPDPAWSLPQLTLGWDHV